MTLSLGHGALVVMNRFTSRYKGGKLGKECRCEGKIRRELIEGASRGKAFRGKERAEGTMRERRENR